jgi:excisionase family DNA binding protein
MSAETPVSSVLPPLLIADVEAARLLGISRAHLHRLRVAGRFPEAIRLGRALRFDRAELVEWAAQKCPDLATWRAMRAAAGRRNNRIVG